MSSYTCFVHTRASMTPHRCVIEARNDGEILFGVSTLLEEWPSFQLLDLYDAKDRLVMRLSPDAAQQIS